MANRTIIAIAAAICTGAASAQFLEDLPSAKPKEKFGELKFSGGNLTANRKTGEMTATGDIKAESGDYRFFTQNLSRNANGVYDFGQNSMMM